MRKQLDLALIGLSAIGWHLFRILTLRPAFRNLAGTQLAVTSFVVLYFAAGLLRWSVLGGETNLVKVSLGLMFYLAGFALALFVCDALIALFNRRTYSMATLGCALLGASAVLDLLVSAAYLVGLVDTVSPPYSDPIELTLMACVVVQFFFAEPDAPN